MNISIEFKDVAHHYLTSGIRCHFYKVGKTYANGDHDGYATLNHAHLELMRGGHWIVVPELREVGSMTTDEMKVLWRLVFGGWKGGNIRFSETALDFRGLIQFIKSTGSMTSDRWVLVQGIERLGIEHQGSIWADCGLHNFGFDSHLATHWLYANGYDVHGLIAAGKATRKEVLDV